VGFGVIESSEEGVGVGVVVLVSSARTGVTSAKVESKNVAD
jgi:hypothetical protein